MAKNKSKLGIKIQGKKKKLHPLVAAIVGFFGVVLLAVTFTAHIYKDVSPLQEVAGAATVVNNADRNLSSITPTSSCLIVRSIIGQGICSKDSYTSLTVTCGDGTTTKLHTTDGTTKVNDTTTCRSLTAWSMQVAQACKDHVLCTPSKIPTAAITKPRPSTSPFLLPHTQPTNQVNHGNK